MLYDLIVVYFIYDIIKMLYFIGMIGMGVQGGPIGALGGISSGRYIFVYTLDMVYLCVCFL
jgi:hypothetical protein